MNEEDENFNTFGGRIPPSNVDAERAVLGAMLRDQDAYHEMLELLKPNQFYVPAHRRIFQALLSLSPKGKPADAVILAETLKEEGQLEEVGGVSAIADLTMGVPSLKNVAHYGNIVKDTFHLRELARAATEISDTAFGGTNVDEAFQEAEARLSDLSSDRLGQGGQKFSELLEDALANFHNRLEGNAEDMGLSSPWPTVRQKIPGFRGGEMVVIAARPSMGKTSFALNLMLDMALQQKESVIMFSLEMTSLQITNNLLCIDAEMDAGLWRKPNASISEKERDRIMNSYHRLTAANIFIDDDPTLTPTLLRAKCRRMKKNHGLSAVVIDYLQLMGDDPGNTNRNDGRTQEMSNISRQLKAIAKEFEVPIFALAQLNRGVEARTDKIPRMSDLRESGSIEQDADVVILLNRPEYYSTDANNPIRPGEADIIIAKNRHGEVGTAPLLFIKNRMTFTEKD